MGRGTGHFRPLILLLLLLLSLLLLLLAAAAAAVSRAASRAATWRKLSLRASALGHDRANRMRRTARLEALLRARVSESPPESSGAKLLLLLLLLLLSSSSAAAFRGAETAVLLLYARERETSAGAMQKSISFTLPRSPVLLILLLLLLLLLPVVVVVVGMSAERSDKDADADDTPNVVLVVVVSTCSSLSTGGCSMSAPRGVRNMETGAVVVVRHLLRVCWETRVLSREFLPLVLALDADGRNGRC